MSNVLLSLRVVAVYAIKYFSSALPFEAQPKSQKLWLEGQKQNRVPEFHPGPVLLSPNRILPYSYVLPSPEGQ